MSSKDYSIGTYFEQCDYTDLHVGIDGKLVILQNKDPGKYRCQIIDVMNGAPKH